MNKIRRHSCTLCRHLRTWRAFANGVEEDGGGMGKGRRGLGLGGAGACDLSNISIKVAHPS